MLKGIEPGRVGAMEAGVFSNLKPFIAVKLELFARMREHHMVREEITFNGGFCFDLIKHCSCESSLFQSLNKYHYDKF